jgi:hypothetical protein
MFSTAGYFLYPAVQNIPGGIIFYRGDKRAVENYSSWYVLYSRVQEEPQKNTSSSTFVPYL